MTEINTGLARVQYASLDDLFAVNTDERVRGEVKVQTIDGKYIVLPMKSLDADTEQKIRKTSTTKVPQKKGLPPLEQMNEAKYNALMIAAATDETRTNINWSSPELQKKVGAPVPNPEFVVPKILSLGGIVKATQFIVELSGLGQDSMEEEIDAVKN
ncbi:phage tail assembly chaperone [Bacillus wiedmannii]|uniref:phage tail assembly chaperone n=1 Tax=Bacillus wiedmannii TaxID=1890302 RepID=UPI003CEE5AB9